MTAGRKPKLNLVAVHGTFSGVANLPEGEEPTQEFYSSSSDFAQKLTSELSEHYNVNWLDFQWSGANLESERAKASQDLSTYLNAEISPDVPLLLLAHSHGGNVAFDWISRNADKCYVRLVTVGTPFVHLGRVRLNHMFTSTIIALVFGCVAAGSVAALGLLLTGNIDGGEVSVPVSVFLFLAMIIAFIVPLFVVVIKPFRRLRDRWKSRQKETLPDKLVYTICHPGDEAVSFLKSKTKLKVPVTFLARPLLVIVFFIYWVVLNTVFALIGFEGRILNAFDVFGLLTFSSAFAMIATAITVLLPMKLIGKYIGSFLERIMGNALSGVLWDLAKGSDTAEPITMQRDPQLPGGKFVRLDADHPTLAKALDAADKESLIYLSNNKSHAVQGLMETGGNFFELLKDNPEVAKSLLHCNYFNLEMAEYLGGCIPDMFGDAGASADGVSA